METLLPLIIGIVIGGALIYFLLRNHWRAERASLRAELIARLEEKAQANQARIIQSYEGQLSVLKTEQQAVVKQARKESTDQSRAVLKGKMAEQIAPLLPGFDYWPADARFLGDPIDYVVFNGYTEVKDNHADGEELEVVILDIKKGRAGLSKGQRRIAQAIEAGRMRFEIVRVFDDGTIKRHTWKPRKRASSPGES